MAKLTLDDIADLRAYEREREGFRDHVIAPILAGVKIRRHDHVPARLTPIDQDYEHLRTDMATLFRHLGIQPGPSAA